MGILGFLTEARELDVFWAKIDRERFVTVGRELQLAKFIDLERIVRAILIARR